MYIILAAPLSAIRWIGKTGGKTLHIPPAVIAIAAAMFGMSGALSVLLLLLTHGNAVSLERQGPDEDKSRSHPSLTPLSQWAIDSDGGEFKERGSPMGYRGDMSESCQNVDVHYSPSP